MKSILANHATHALQTLCNRAGEAQNALQEQTRQAWVPESDNESGSKWPILEFLFNAQRTAAIQKMTKCSVRELHQIDNKFHGTILSGRSCGWGRKTEVKPKNALFMMLVFLKRSGSWELIAKTFRYKTQTIKIQNYFKSLQVQFLTLHTVSSSKFWLRSGTWKSSAKKAR